MTTGLDERRAARARDPFDDRPAPRRWPIILAAGLVLALLGGAFYVVWATPVFGLQTIAVSGADPSLADSVQIAADERTGTPLLRIDTDAVQQRLRALPQIESATVERSWPHTLLITVVGRVPVAVTKANGAYWLLDSSGLPYQKIDSPPSGLVTLELATPHPGDPATMAAIAVANALTTDFRSQVISVSAPSAYRVTLTLKNDKTVVWGAAQDNARKMQILPAVLKQPGRVYDVSVPDLVTVR